MSYRLRSSWLAFVVLLLLVPLGACNCNNTASDSAEADGEKAKESAAVEPDNEQAQAQAEDAPPGDLYPGMNFGALSPAERITFVDIAKAEVCPCPDAAESLHECLQDTKTACNLARQVANVAAMEIRKGHNETDIINKIAQFAENARKQHDFVLEGVPHKGPEEAPVTIVEFADFECPHCKMASGVMDVIAKKYGDQVAVYFKQFPLRSHGNAELAARAALAAHEQGKFWQMHDLIFKNQRSLSPEKIQTFARRLGMNVGKFKQDLQSQEIAAKVARDRQEGDRAGITGTPAVFINGVRYQGPIDPNALSQAIDTQLAEADQAEQGE